MLRRHYGKEADIWSCGVMLYILLCGVPPFWGETEHQIFDAILKGRLDFDTDPWPAISTEAKECVKAMLQPVRSNPNPNPIPGAHTNTRASTRQQTASLQHSQKCDWERGAGIVFIMSDLRIGWWPRRPCRARAASVCRRMQHLVSCGYGAWHKQMAGAEL